MSLRATALAGLLFLCALSPLRGELKITGETKVKTHHMVRLKVEGLPEGAVIFWRYDKKALDGGAHADRLWVTGAPGEYLFEVNVVSVDPKDGKKLIGEQAEITVTIGEPAPVPPVPPGPVPPVPPTPPGPTPPTPIAGLKVLLVEETADRPKLSAAQKAILDGLPFHLFLDSKCADDPDTQSKKGWRLHDKDQDLRLLAKFYQDAQSAVKGKSMPRIVIGSDAGGIAYEGPLPATVKEAQDLVNKYAAAKAPLRKAG